MLASADGYFYIYNIPEQVSPVKVKCDNSNTLSGRGLCDGKAAQTGPRVWRRGKLFMSAWFHVLKVEENEGSARDCPAVIPVSQVLSTCARPIHVFRCASISCTDDRNWLTGWLIETGDWQFRMFDSSRTTPLVFYPVGIFFLSVWSV